MLAQHPPGGKRTAAQDAAFKDALNVMADVYASAVGTTVLQLKEIPPRPARFDGVLCLFGLTVSADEAVIREALGCFGEITSCDVSIVFGGPKFNNFEQFAAEQLPGLLATTELELRGALETLKAECALDNPRIACAARSRRRGACRDALGRLRCDHKGRK